MNTSTVNDKWALTAERGSPILIRFIAWLARTAGRTPARVLLHPICIYFMVMAPNARRQSLAYLTRVLPHRPTLGDAYRHIHTFASTILDRVLFLTGRYDPFDIRFEGVEDLYAAKAKQKGVILLGAHFGSFDAIRAIADTHPDMELKVFMHVRDETRVAQVLNELNRDMAERTIPLGDTTGILEAHEWLQQGGMLGILGDRITYGDKTRQVDFLGSPASFPTGPWLLGAMTGAPVVMFGGIYEGHGRYVIRFKLLSEGEKIGRATRDEAISRHIETYASTLEQWVRASPLNWFNFYAFWD